MTVCGIAVAWYLPAATPSMPSNDEFDSLELDRHTEFHLLSRLLAETTTDIGTVGQEMHTLMPDFEQ
ncbi:hypothetical protein LBMAG52_32950 [Planctomycetia bacterium]|nr:hypothetical protein LBMAG52_32950 [Planctomycetia bacterium]